MAIVLRAWSVAACAALLLTCSHESVRAADPSGGAATPASSLLPSYRTPRLLLTVVAGDRTDEYGVFVELSGVQDATLHLDAAKVRLQLRRDGARNTLAVASPRPEASPPSNYATTPPERASAFPAFAGYRLDLASRAPGWYTLSVDADADAIVHTNGIAFKVDQVRTEPLRVYVPPSPDNPPSYAPGGRFIFLPGFIYGRSAPSFLGSHGDREPLGSRALRPLTYRGPHNGMFARAIRFAAADGKTTIDGTDDPRMVPGLFPLVEDATSRAVAAKYAGRDVWRFGRGPLFAGFMQNVTLDMRPGKPARVLGVYRPFGFPYNAALGSSPFALPNYLSIDPLVVVLHVRSANLQLFAMGAIPAEGPTGYWLVSGTWDMERTFSLVSMQQAHPDWSAAMRDAVLAQKILPGMTRDMVAWSRGYPSVAGTVDAMNALDVWHFEQAAPSSSSVFFRGGHVVRYDPPGQLP